MTQRFRGQSARLLAGVAYRSKGSVAGGKPFTEASGQMERQLLADWEKLHETQAACEHVHTGYQRWGVLLRSDKALREAERSFGDDIYLHVHMVSDMLDGQASQDLDVRRNAMARDRQQAYRDTAVQSLDIDGFALLDTFSHVRNRVFYLSKDHGIQLVDGLLCEDWIHDTAMNFVLLRIAD